MKTTALITSDTKRTEDQEKHFGRLLDDAVNRATPLALKKVNPTREGIQQVIRRGDELINRVVDTIIELTGELSNPDQFANEEVRSNYRYPEEYKGPRPIKEQIQMLANIFGLSPDDALAYAETIASKPLNGGEGRFAIVSDAGLAKLFPNVTDPAERFCLGCDLVLEKIEATKRPFHNYRKGQLTKDRLRRHIKTTAAYEKIALEQKGDIWIIDAQLAMAHRGQSVRWARVCFGDNEYGLDPIAGGSIALTHPERFVRSSELDIDCAGAEFAPDADGDFSRAPLFDFFDGKLWFDTIYVGGPNGRFGSASGFTSQ